MEDRFFYLPFSVFDGVGVITFRNLMQYFKSAERIWRASDSEIVNSPLPKHLHTKFIDFRKTFHIDKYVEKMMKNKIWFWTVEDENYPKLLKEIYDPPFVLFYKKMKDSRRLIADFRRYINLSVVGSRKITKYGVRAIEDLIGGLSGEKICIVSGLALGVDALAHQTALQNDLSTIAVLGCGLDIIYPRENSKLADEILEKDGLILSEVPLGRFVTRGIFPARNRIVSGMSQATLIIEAAENSGSLITASYALDQGRDVLVVPGPINSPNEKGIIGLLRKGAIPVSSAEEILLELGINISGNNAASRHNVKEKLNFGSDIEKKVYEVLTNEGQTHINEMCRRLKIDVSELSTILTMMEIRGLVKNIGNLEYDIN